MEVKDAKVELLLLEVRRLDALVKRYEDAERARIEAELAALNRPVLSGIGDIFVMVDVSDRAEGLGIDERALKTIVELRLRQAGIRLRTREEGMKTGGSALYANLNAFPSGPGFAASCELSLLTSVKIQRNTRQTQAPIWDSQHYGLVDAPRARDAFRSMADEFANEYLAANPP